MGKKKKRIKNKKTQNFNFVFLYNQYFNKLLIFNNYLVDFLVFLLI